MSVVTASVARQTLPAQLDRVAAGDEVAITRHGRVVAVLVRPDTLRSRRTAEAWADAERIGALLEQARTEPLDGGSMTPERAEELVQEIHADRRGR